LPFTIITNKDYFPRKNDYKLNFRKFTVAVYLWLWRHWCQLVEQRRPEKGKMKCFYYYNYYRILLQPNATQ